MDQGKIIFIMGVSGSGKGTLMDNIKNHPWKNIAFPLTYRTREPRPGEVHGVHSWFVSTDEFRKMIEDEKLLEWAIVHKVAYYGAAKDDILENGIWAGKNVLKEIEVQGLQRIKQDFPELAQHLLTVFLDASDDILRERITGRDPSVPEEEIRRRLQTAQGERARARDLCDYIIDTDKTPEQIFEEVKTIFLQHEIS